ncbi:aldehyde dehydrogenase family protein [Gordonia sp. KTR9]|uniref:aldehyde dehydrogenase family protein n=1 Tax=Gordonia sp. KTR9 TaxID=337191 RepID=UPI00027DEA02|nr:aldehyde dehydrogenase family protein [Gordonia sp. KTR9]AFR49445.1 putative benzaldehyde dehydrogenase [Gordonia sp. KTR9]
MTAVDETAGWMHDPSPQALGEALSGLRAGFREEGPPTLQTRLDRIDRFVGAVLGAADEIAEALHADFGNRSRLANLANDIVGAIRTASIVRANLVDWMQDRAVEGSDSAGTPTFIQSRPKGVVGVIGPWNFPVGLVTAPTIEALGAGNRVMIKFSDIPERTAEAFARAVAGSMDPSEVTVVTGGIGTAQAFSNLRFDHILFTGSPGVGAMVAESAGRNLVPVTLELGGKNPVVISPDADLEQAATRIASFRLLNGGQVCLCPDYVFVPRDLMDSFVDEYTRVVRRFFATFADDPAVTSLINERNFDRIRGLVDDAVAKGATGITICDATESDRLPDRETRRIAPTILLDVTADMAIAEDEIFGPVIVVYPYDDLDEAINYIVHKPSPLAAYWFGPDDASYRRYIERTTSGGVTRNDIGAHWGVEGAPSGGIGRSGLGAYTGYTGFTTFSHLRTIATSERARGTAEFAMPPAGEVEADALAAMISQAKVEIEMRTASS